MKTVKENAEETLRLLRQHGWTQNHFEDLKGRMCLLGAVNRATGVNPMMGSRSIEYRNLTQAIKKVLTAVSDDYYSLIGRPSISYWNDRPSTTFKDVEKLLERVIANEV